MHQCLRENVRFLGKSPNMEEQFLQKVGVDEAVLGSFGRDYKSKISVSLEK